jgi:hypothetical protein
MIFKVSEPSELVELNLFNGLTESGLFVAFEHGKRN